MILACKVYIACSTNTVNASTEKTPQAPSGSRICRRSLYTPCRTLLSQLWTVEFCIARSKLVRIIHHVFTMVLCLWSLVLLSVHPIAARILHTVFITLRVANLLEQLDYWGEFFCYSKTHIATIFLQLISERKKNFFWSFVQFGFFFLMICFFFWTKQKQNHEIAFFCFLKICEKKNITTHKKKQHFY